MHFNRYSASMVIGMAAFAATVQAAPDTGYVQQLENARQGVLAQNNPDAARGRASESSGMSHDSMMKMCRDMMGDSSSAHMDGMRMHSMPEGSSTVLPSEAFFNKASGGVSPP